MFKNACKDLEETLLRSKISKNIFLAVMHGSRTNQEDLRYKCSFCIAFNVPVKSFKRTEQLQRHYHNHLNVRLYKCFSCDKRFKVGFCKGIRIEYYCNLADRSPKKTF